ncbi:MAG TPA: peptide chain release factor N(5)-glutamine methyltransferase [Bauldia sp.]|nr:peptide chain release factor N(5)-glutamine methyltransferase [Bauldia sp.]
MTTVSDLRREIARQLAASPTAALDARLLVAHVLGIAPADLILADPHPVDAASRERALALAARRAAGEPVGRILGHREFWGLDLRLSPETLEPRPDSETLVEAALASVSDRLAPLRILDLGTGTGAILLALLSELPAATGIGADRSPGALATAAANARRHDLDGRARFVAADWTGPFAGRFDLVVSNPPYVASREIDSLPVEVRGFDPHLGLDGGEDGLAAYRAILAGIGRLVADGGRALLEVGQGQAAEVAEMGRAAGLAPAFHRDLAGVERVVSFRRR